MKSGTFRVQPDLLRKLPCYLCSLVTFKYSTYNVRSQDVLTLAVSLVLNELGQSRFMYYTANKWLTYFCVFLIVKMCWFFLFTGLSWKRSDLNETALLNKNVCYDLFLRTREDEVHVTAGRSDPEMEPRYNEAGAVPGSYSGEQQRRRTQGKGMSASCCMFVEQLLKFAT